MEVGVLPLGDKAASVPGSPLSPARHQKHWSRHFGGWSLCCFLLPLLGKYGNCASFTSTLSQLFEHAHWPSTVLRDSGLSWEEPGFCHQTDLSSKEGSVPVGLGGLFNLFHCLYLTNLWIVLQNMKTFWADCHQKISRLFQKCQITYKFLTSDEITDTASFQLTGLYKELLPLHFGLHSLCSESQWSPLTLKSELENTTRWRQYHFNRLRNGQACF